MTETIPAASTQPESSAFARLIGVLFSPAKTFESIARKPGLSWLLPVLILSGLTIVGGIYINPKLDTDAAIKQAMKRVEARGDLTDAQREQARHAVEGQFNAIKSGWIRFLGPCFVFIPLLFVSFVYWGIAKAMGAGGKYGTILAGYAFAMTPQIIKAILGIAVALPRESIDLNDAERIVKSSVGAFMDSETISKPLMAVLTSIDLFEIWGLVLCSIMLARTTKLSKNAATISVVSVWVIYVLFKVFGAALGAAFGG